MKLIKTVKGVWTWISNLAPWYKGEKMLALVSRHYQSCPSQP